MPRLRRALRATLFAAVVLAMWTLSRPALAASAPLCDDRGASGMAPPPSLEAPDVAVQRARTPPSCDGLSAPLTATLTHTHHGLFASAAAAEHAVPVARTLLAPPGAELLEVAPPAARPRQGVRWRIERPPRG
ncbi:MAG TPA: hypothetical protein VIF15_10075 [Polyangiaceae bacterium]|jgi:hypothetical protein